MAAVVTLVTHAQLEEFLKEAEKKGQQTLVLNADGTNVAVVTEDPPESKPKHSSKEDPEPEPPKSKQAASSKDKEHHYRG